MPKKDFEMLCGKYQKQMFLVAEGVLHNRADAEDAVQNALLRIANTSKPLPENEKALRAYLLTAARNAAIDLLPKRPPEVDLDDIVIAADEDLFTQVAASEDYTRLLAAIDCLPLKYREVLMLRYVQGFEVSEIASLFARPSATVQKQLLRAKYLLLRKFEI